MTAAAARPATTVVQRPVPAVRVLAAASAEELAAAVREAVGLLLEAGLLRIAGPGERADLLHTIGDVDLPHGPAALRRLHTVDRVALRRGGDLAPTRRWVHQQHRRAADCSFWLVHGSTAGRLVVGAGLAAGERVHCLPVLAPVRAPNPAWASRRAVEGRLLVRRRLGIAPGVRLVAGPGHALQGPGDWAAALDRLRRPDLRVLRLSIRGRGGALPFGLSFHELLDASDCFVAPGGALTAISPAVSALAAGVPVVAVSTDSAAELVTPGRDGVVVAPRIGAVVAAVVAHLDNAPRRVPRGIAPEQPSAERLARSLLHVYGRALAAPGRVRRAQG
jgi:glycosyltransferase involved in cell wall biosynthesis